MTPALLCVGGGLLLVALAVHPSPAAGRFAADALPCFALALAWRWCQAPEQGLPDALRLRRRSRVIALRLGSLPGVGAAVAIAVAAAEPGAAGSGALESALWLAVAAPVPVLLEAALWRLVPGAVRRDVGLGVLVEEMQALNAGPSRVLPLVFDPGLGHAGRVAPLRRVPRPARPGGPCEVRPQRHLVLKMTLDPRFSLPEQRWLTGASLRWDGSALVLADAVGPSVAAPAQPGARRLAGEPVELVWVAEQHGGALVPEVRLVLLDAQDRRLLTMPGLGFDERKVMALAVAAGLAFSRYYLRLPATDRFGRGLLARMFPRRRGHIRLVLR